MHTERIATLLQQLTLEEKIALLAGASFWLTVPVERLGIPAIKVTDGPNGARGDGLFNTGKPAASFPVGIALAATWDVDLIEQIGMALGDEARTKGAHVLLAPTVNIHRTPLNGRNFEAYSEDPFLTAEIGTAYIKGVQSRGVAATVKHFAGNESEYQRMSISSEIGERALREIYLPPFKAAVQKAGVWAVMSAYNKVNGIHCSEHPYLLHDILRDEWGFDGVVMSDWTGTRSTVDSVNAGQDLEMPGPTVWRGEKVLQAVQRGEIAETTLDESVRRLLGLIERVGAFEHPDIPAEQSVLRPEHAALIRKAGADAAVLLKNTGILPLDPGRIEKLAIIGPNVQTAQIMGGGSAQLNPHYRVTPYAGVMTRAGDRLEIGYEPGCTNHRTLPAVNVSWFEGGRVSVDYFASLDLSGPVAAAAQTDRLEMIWVPGAMPPGIDPRHFSARFSGQFKVPASGHYDFAMTCSGRGRLFIDQAQVFDSWDHPTGDVFMLDMSAGQTFGELDLTAGVTYHFRLEYSAQGADMLAGVRVGCFLPLSPDAIQRAVQLAAESDVALVFVGLNSEWESEGFDRPDLELTGEQNALVAQVAAANPRTVVVLQTGSPVSMPWLDDVAAVLQAWYPGQECGNAIADVLFGDVTPSGKLTQTYPRRLEDHPAFINYPGENGKVHYGEGIFVGYRYYEKKRIAPLFPFGFGLSYTSFDYANLRLSAPALSPHEPLQVSIDVTNTGARAGQEIVQVYVRDVEAPVMRPEKELKAFAKVALQPGETRTVPLTLTREAFAYYDDARRAWVAEEGDFEILVGASSADIRAQVPFRLTETAVFDAAEAEA